MAWACFRNTILLTLSLGTTTRVSTPLGSDLQSPISHRGAPTSPACHVMSMNTEAVAGMMNGTLTIWWSMRDRNILLSDLSNAKLKGADQLCSNYSSSTYI